ncbi:hypothetical protein D3C85_1529190 [compost metagenome]
MVVVAVDVSRQEGYALIEQVAHLLRFGATEDANVCAHCWGNGQLDRARREEGEGRRHSVHRHEHLCLCQVRELEVIDDRRSVANVVDVRLGDLRHITLL